MELAHQLDEQLGDFWRYLSVWQAPALCPLEGVRQKGAIDACVVDHYGDDVCLARCHPVGEAVGVVPLAPEVAAPVLLAQGLTRDYRQEQRTSLEAAPDAALPVVSHLQGILVEPHLQARRTQPLGQSARGVEVIACVADANRSVGNAPSALACIRCHGP